MLILMVTFGQQYDCTAGNLVMGISGLPRNKCDRQFSLKFNLQQHFSSLHEGIRFSCQFCNNSYTRKTNLMAHIKDVHGLNNTQSLKDPITSIIV